MTDSPLLLDSNVLIFLEQNPKRIPLSTLQRISTAQHVFVSAVTAWELGIKQARGQLALARPVSQLVSARSMIELPVTIQHGETVRSLPLHHHDPFDRMLVAQAMIEGLIFVTSDKFLLLYGIPTLLV
ncbi:MAG TPA: type II toxin-antitoxin system VapC family toxin [Acidobacteriaceae bacterium]|jgi:PIN domain nuclease of toxin-antitoxin system|nr:type II toxin-antitoxin system VapC family toxin [Acidobacteriaceae bacterium]